MRIPKMIAVLAATALLAAPSRAQQKPSDAAANDSVAAYRVQVVISEYDGATKISSLPYTVPVALIGGDPFARGSLRVGIRVPLNTSTKTGESAVQYTDVGTNLDVRVKRGDADRYELELTFERSSLYVREQNKDGKVEGRAWAPGDPAPSLAPIWQQFRANFGFLLRDGRSAETAAVTDPITGHVMKVEAVLAVLK